MTHLPLRPLQTLRFNFLLSIFFLSGCGLWLPSEPAPESTAPAAALESVTLYLSRTDWKQSEFEQLKLVGTLLFKECGDLRHGRHFPELQDTVRLEQGVIDSLSEAAAPLIEKLQQGPLQVDPPGDNNSLFDPGQARFAFSIGEKTLKVDTNVNAVAEPGTSTERRLNEIARILRRAAGLPLCGNSTFYGIRP